MGKKINIVKTVFEGTVSESEKEIYNLRVFVDDKDHYCIERRAERNKVRNLVDTFTKIDSSGEKKIEKLNYEYSKIIFDRIISGSHKWSDAFLFIPQISLEELNWEKTEQEHKYTSTGIKFWRHRTQMENYKAGANNTVISTHISPEGACNLKCPYFSVTYRDTHSRISLPRIKDYVNQLIPRGLKAVILTGGGEPTLYKHFNELVLWLHNEKKLSVGLITK